MGQNLPYAGRKRVLEAGLEDLSLYENILSSGITKVATRTELFPCAEVIKWIMPRVDSVVKIMKNVEDKGIASFTLAFIAKAYSLPTSEISMKTELVKNLKFDYIGTAKMMVAEGKTFINK